MSYKNINKPAFIQAFTDKINTINKINFSIMSGKLCDRVFLGNKLRPFPDVDEFMNEFDDDQEDFYCAMIACKTKEIWATLKPTLDEKTIKSFRGEQIKCPQKNEKIWPFIRHIKSIFIDKQKLLDEIKPLKNANIEECTAFIMEWIRTASYFTNCTPTWSKSNVIYHPETEQFELFFNKGLLDFLIWIETEGGLRFFTFKNLDA